MTKHRHLYKALWKKTQEALVSVLPVVLLVVLLNLTPLVDFSGREIFVFLCSSFFLVLGVGLFNFGADIAMMPMGEHIGAGLAKTKKLPVLLCVCFAMGVLITVAEPDLSVLASQVRNVISPTVLLISVGVGVGLFLLIAVAKIVFRTPLSSLLLYFYVLLFALAALVAVNGNGDMLGLAFDSGGVTTGPITVPFIMAMGVGIAATLGGRAVGENSFGLIALCSVGPMLDVSFLGCFMRGGISYTQPDYSVEAQLGAALAPAVFTVAKEVAVAVGMIAASFFVLNLLYLRLPRKKLIQISVGILYTVLGLVVFLAAVSVGFMPIGYKLGAELAARSPLLLTAGGFVLGTVAVLAEPAVHVLKRQVAEITSGTVGKKALMLALSVGVGLSVGLSMLRIVFDFSILYYLVPGYFLSLGLSFFVPGLYTAIAFDAGGVASGPLTSGFILPLAIGACGVLQGEAKIMADGFGIVAMVAMTPLITIQLLGFRAVFARKLGERIALRRMLSADDEQIIEFL